MVTILIIPLSFSSFFLYCTCNLGAKYLVFVSSCSVKMRELSFPQFVYFLRKVCLFFNFWMIEFTIVFCLTRFWILSFKNWKMNTISTCFDRMRGDNNQIFRTLVCPAFSTSAYISYLDVSALQPYHTFPFLRKLPQCCRQFTSHHIQGLTKSALIVLRMSGFIHDNDNESLRL